MQPLLCILEIYPKDQVIPSKTKVLINICFLHAAKRLIALFLEASKPANLGHWMREMSSCLAMEKICYI